ncbi:MAG: DUF3667 domain-containing protein [Prevotella sp.]|nr:DUF3667 domain-containing protein [Prevotella sp.]MBR3080034.1 DUF3667 domain-containing protein [Prevotella sp.]MBR3111145.1 DUF3667 domain-containing protein [Prevotella sp.]
MKNLHNRYKRFKEWEQQPHQVAPLSEDHHECATCGTHYEGNYCPRCGQSAKIGRYSFKNAILLYLDVWGLGNRGMFRSIRDLILRPGYMIRDYLRGMQMAYFPPFKMFFLLLALSLLVDSGMNIQGINREKQNEKETEELFSRVKPKATLDASNDKADEKKTGKLLTKEEKEKRFGQEFERKWDKIIELIDQHSSAVTIVGLLIFSLPLYLLFRHSPAIPDLRLSECFVAMVYITNMIVIYDIIPSLLCFSVKAEIVFDMLILLLAIIPIKQLSGYSYVSTIWRLIAALIPFIIMCLLLLFAAIIIIVSTI